MEINGRLMTRADRVLALRRGLKRRQASLERSLAHSRGQGRRPSERELARWAKLQSEIAAFQEVLAKLARGEFPPPSPKTGRIAALLPDRIDKPEPKDEA